MQTNARHRSRVIEDGLRLRDRLGAVGVILNRGDTLRLTMRKRLCCSGVTIVGRGRDLRWTTNRSRLELGYAMATQG